MSSLTGVTFTSLGGEALPAAIQSISTSPGGDSWRIRFAMAYDVFERSLVDEAFNLLPDVLLGKGAASLEPGREVVIDALLRSAAARGFAARHGDVNLTADRLANDAELLRADSWLALTLVQDVELPAGMVGDGAHAAVGCETRWNRSASGGESAKVIAETAFESLVGLGYRVDAVNEHLVRTVATRGERRWVVLVHGDESERTCVCWSVYPENASAEQRAAVAAFLMETNYELSIGSFEMDSADGEIRFRTSVDLGETPLDAEVFARLLGRNIDGFGRVLPLLDAYFG